MFEDLKKAQRKRKKKKIIAQRAKAEQAHAAQKAKASARPNITTVEKSQVVVKETSNLEMLNLDMTQRRLLSKIFLRL